MNQHKFQHVACTQCGAAGLEPAGEGRLRCAFCGSLFALLENSPKVIIGKGAKVIFGKNANVEIRGGMQVQEGADVAIDGKVTVLADGKPQVFRLRLIEKGGKRPE